jgi:phage portal protein BeeE
LEEHQAQFVVWGSRPDGMPSTDRAIRRKRVREQLRDEWERLQAGSRNARATAILEQGLKWEPLGLTMVDSWFVESRNFQLRDIARAFDVPPYERTIAGEKFFGRDGEASWRCFASRGIGDHPGLLILILLLRLLALWRVPAIRL